MIGAKARPAPPCLIATLVNFGAVRTDLKLKIANL